MATYRVTFTTRSIVSRFDEKGKKIGETIEHRPQVINGLPYPAAIAYKDRDNFEFEVEREEARKQLPKPASSGFDHQLKKAKKASRPASAPASRVQNAARTGDVSAALDAA